MTKASAKSLGFLTLMTLVVLFVLGAQSADALTRTQRIDAALVRQNIDQGGTTGGGSTSSSSGDSGENTEGNVNVDGDMAQQLFDDLIENGPNTDELPEGTNINTDEATQEVEDALENAGENPTDYSFINIIRSFISRFTNR